MLTEVASASLVTLAGTATPAQFAEISKYRPAGLAPRSPEDWMVLPIAAADNLVNRGYGRWTPAALQKITTMAAGIPLILEHEWSDPLKARGVVFAAAMVTIPPTAALLSHGLLSGAGMMEANRAIAGVEGYQAVVMMAATPIVQDRLAFLDAVSSGAIASVSLGAFQLRSEDYGCPICKTPFADARCPHLPPDGRYYLPGDHEGDLEVAPYYERLTTRDLGEVSFVNVPNLPKARIISQGSPLAPYLTPGG